MSKILASGNGDTNKVLRSVVEFGAYMESVNMGYIESRREDNRESDRKSVNVDRSNGANVFKKNKAKKKAASKQRKINRK